MAEPRGSKVVSHSARKLRETMVANLERVMAIEYPGKTPTAIYEAIGEATGNSLSTMQRVMSGKTGPSIDTLADIARHLGVSVAEILSPPSGQAKAGADPFPKPPERTMERRKQA